MREARILTLIDEYTRECVWPFWLTVGLLPRTLSSSYFICLYPGVSLSIFGLITVLNSLPERYAAGWTGVKTLFIERGSPWENGYIESFNGKLRDELLNWEVFTTLTEAKVLIEQWRREYNQVRPHSALGYRLPAPEVIMPVTLT